MPVVYLILLAAACVLLALAAECLIKGVSALNLSAAALLAALGVLLACVGLADYFNLVRENLLEIWARRIGTFMAVLAGPAAWFFSLHFPRDEEKRPRTRSASVLLAVSALAGLTGLFGLDASHSFAIDAGRKSAAIYLLKVHYNAWHYVLLGLSFGAAALSFVRIVLKHRGAQMAFQKKQIFYLLSGCGAALAFLAVSAATAPFIAPVSLAFLALSFLTLGAFILYTVINYRFMNFRKKLYEMSGKALTGCVAALPLALLIFLFRQPMARLHPLLFIALMVVYLILFYWLYQLLSSLLRKTIGRDDRRKDLTEDFLDRIGLSRNVDELASSMLQVLAGALQCRGADFLYFDKDGEAFKVLASLTGSAYSIPAIDPFFRHLREGVDVYDREQIYADPSYHALRHSAERYFQRHGATLVVPLFSEKNLVALVNISRRDTNSVYEARDFILISKIKKVVNIILSNIILFEKEQDAKVTKRDIMLASDIQESLFQKEMPSFKGMDAYACQKPAKWVSGDYFMVNKVSDGKMGLLIADVSGKGVSAALVSMMIHSIARSHVFSANSTNGIVSGINELLTSSGAPGSGPRVLSFATVLCCFVSHSQKAIYYTSAGHLPAVLYNPSTGKVRYLGANAMPAGIFPQTQYRVSECGFEDGSILALYSDGITEAVDKKEEEFGTERLVQALKDNRAGTAREITEAVLDSVDKFTESGEQFDDITLIVIKL